MYPTAVRLALEPRGKGASATQGGEGLGSMEWSEYTNARKRREDSGA